MPTIKRKEEMTLPQLIEWAWENDIKNATYRSKNELFVTFPFDGKGVIGYGYAFSKNDTFTVEIKEEITEKTKIWQLIELRDEGLLGRTYLHKNESIENIKTDNSLVFYFIDEDLTATVIWKNGKLVD